MSANRLEVLNLASVKDWIEKVYVNIDIKRRYDVDKTSDGKSYVLITNKNKDLKIFTIDNPSPLDYINANESNSSSTIQPPIGQPPISQPPIDQPPIDQPPIDQPPILKPPILKPPTLLQRINNRTSNESNVNNISKSYKLNPLNEEDEEENEEENEKEVQERIKLNRLISEHDPYAEFRIPTNKTSTPATKINDNELIEKLLIACFSLAGDFDLIHLLVSKSKYEPDGPSGNDCVKNFYIANPIKDICRKYSKSNSGNFQILTYGNDPKNKTNDPKNKTNDPKNKTNDPKNKTNDPIPLSNLVQGDYDYLMSLIINSNGSINWDTNDILRKNNEFYIYVKNTDSKDNKLMILAHIKKKYFMEFAKKVSDGDKHYYNTNICIKYSPDLCKFITEESRIYYIQESTLESCNSSILLLSNSEGIGLLILRKGQKKFKKPSYGHARVDKEFKEYYDFLTEKEPNDSLFYYVGKYIEGNKIYVVYPVGEKNYERLKNVLNLKSGWEKDKWADAIESIKSAQEELGTLKQIMDNWLITHRFPENIISNQMLASVYYNTETEWAQKEWGLWRILYADINRVPNRVMTLRKTDPILYISECGTQLQRDIHLARIKYLLDNFFDMPIENKNTYYIPLGMNFYEKLIVPPYDETDEDRKKRLSITYSYPILKNFYFETSRIPFSTDYGNAPVKPTNIELTWYTIFMHYLEEYIKDLSKNCFTLEELQKYLNIDKVTPFLKGDIISFEPRRSTLNTVDDDNKFLAYRDDTLNTVQDYNMPKSTLNTVQAYNMSNTVDYNMLNTVQDDNMPKSTLNTVDYFDNNKLGRRNLTTTVNNNYNINTGFNKQHEYQEEDAELGKQVYPFSLVKNDSTVADQYLKDPVSNKKLTFDGIYTFYDKSMGTTGFYANKYMSKNNNNPFSLTQIPILTFNNTTYKDIWDWLQNKYSKKSENNIKRMVILFVNANYEDNNPYFLKFIEHVHEILNTISSKVINVQIYIAKVTDIEMYYYRSDANGNQIDKHNFNVSAMAFFILKNSMRWDVVELQSTDFERYIREDETFYSLYKSYFVTLLMLRILEVSIGYGNFERFIKDNLELLTMINNGINVTYIPTVQNAVVPTIDTMLNNINNFANKNLALDPETIGLYKVLIDLSEQVGHKVKYNENNEILMSQVNANSNLSNVSNNVDTPRKHVQQLFNDDEVYWCFDVTLYNYDSMIKLIKKPLNLMIPVIPVPSSKDDLDDLLYSILKIDQITVIYYGPILTGKKISISDNFSLLSRKLSDYKNRYDKIRVRFVYLYLNDRTEIGKLYFYKGLINWHTIDNPFSDNKLDTKINNTFSKLIDGIIVNSLVSSERLNNLYSNLINNHRNSLPGLGSPILDGTALQISEIVMYLEGVIFDHIYSGSKLSTDVYNNVVAFASNATSVLKSSSWNLSIQNFDMNATTNMFSKTNMPSLSANTFSSSNTSYPVLNIPNFNTFSSSNTSYSLLNPMSSTNNLLISPNELSAAVADTVKEVKDYYDKREVQLKKEINDVEKKTSELNLEINNLNNEIENNNDKIAKNYSDMHTAKINMSTLQTSQNKLTKLYHERQNKLNDHYKNNNNNNNPRFYSKR